MEVALITCLTPNTEEPLSNKMPSHFALLSNGMKQVV